MFKTAVKQDCFGNHLLSSLSHEELGRLHPAVQHTTLSLGQVIYESGGYLDYVLLSCNLCRVMSLYDA